MSESTRIQTVADFIRGRTAVRPRIAVVLGSGLGGLADQIEAEAIIDYEDIPDFPVSTVPGHAGRLVLGHLAGQPVVAMQGRFHYYEGYPMSDIIFPTRVLQALGAESLIVTNAAGGLNPAFEVGQVMLIADHINLQGTNALIGHNDEAIGPRFPDMTNAYAPELLVLARETAAQLGIDLQEGVYAAVSGPSFETKAERRMLRVLGADAVGMSTVPEVTAANHAGMRVLGFSAITNKATGEPDQIPDAHEDVLEAAAIAGEQLVKLVYEIIASGRM